MTDQEFWSAFPKMAEDALKLYDAASVGIGVIKDGEIVCLNGFGKRDVEAGLGANGQTMYQIGSCTKAFTCALVGKMVDDGLVAWDEPVRTYVPEVLFMDEYANKHITLRDLLAHRTGLPRHEYSWINTDFTREELVEHLRYFEPSQELRARMQYCNYGTILAGYIIEKLTGKTWEAYLQEVIFDNLGMSRSSAYLCDIENDPNHAQPYGHEPGKFSGIAKMDFLRMSQEDKSKGIGAPFGPAGSINSTPEDMLKWVQLFLNKGRAGEKQVLSEAVLKELIKPQMLRYAVLDMPNPETEFLTYGMGWFVELFRGHKFCQHGGNVFGFSGFTGFVPDLNLGIVAYTNQDSSFVHFALARTVIDHYLGIEDGNWVTRYHDFLQKAFDTQDEGIKSLVGERTEGTAPSHNLEEYTGVYRRPGYSDMVITLEDGKLKLNFIKLSITLEHYHYDTFRTADIAGEIPAGYPAFFYSAEVGGTIDRIGMPLVTEEGGQRVVFSKVDETKPSEK